MDNAQGTVWVMRHLGGVGIFILTLHDSLPFCSSIPFRLYYLDGIPDFRPSEFGSQYKLFWGISRFHFYKSASLGLFFVFGLSLFTRERHLQRPPCIDLPLDFVFFKFRFIFFVRLAPLARTCDALTRTAVSTGSPNSRILKVLDQRPALLGFMIRVALLNGRQSASSSES